MQVEQEDAQDAERRLALHHGAVGSFWNKGDTPSGGKVLQASTSEDSESAMASARSMLEGVSDAHARKPERMIDGPIGVFTKFRRSTSYRYFYISTTAYTIGCIMYNFAYINLH